MINTPELKNQTKKQYPTQTNLFSTPNTSIIKSPQNIHTKILSPNIITLKNKI